MATDRLINSDQGATIISKLDTIATQIEALSSNTVQSLGMGYGVCDTAASTLAKVVALTGYNLKEGTIVSVKFNNDVAANSTLNINSKGAKPIYYKGSAITADVIKSGNTATFIYSNGQYLLIGIDGIINDVTTKQDIIDNSHKLSADLVDDTNTTNKFMGSSDSDKLARIKVDSTETQSYYLQDTMPANPSDGDYWFTDDDFVSSDVKAMTGFVKASSSSAITTSDTLNEAIGKLEFKTDTNASNITDIQSTIGDINTVLEGVL